MQTLIEQLKNEPPWALADKIRAKYCGKEVQIRGIIEFSNYCFRNCLYCGLRKDNKALKRYRLEPDEIIAIAQKAFQVGYKTIVLQSGEDPYYTQEMITYIIKGIKKIGDLAITLSLGEREYQEYACWKKAGADRYLLKHETADPKLYAQLHPQASLEKRLQSLYQLKELGYQTGSGFIVGLPGQTVETIAQDLLIFKKLDVEMAGIGPFIPHPDTPLGKNKITKESISLTLKAIALSRIMLKRTHLPTTTALEIAARVNAFQVGANVIMRKVIPWSYRKLYEIYPQTLGKEKTLLEERKAVEKYIKACGRIVSQTRGDAILLNEELI